MSNSKGKGSCQLAFSPFHKTINGKNHSCPPSKKDKKAGWGCGMAVAVPAHRTEYKIAHFTF
jgi:hypothetical protein